MDLSTVLSVVGVLVALTNIITQVLKKILRGKLPTNILAVIISMALTMVAFFCYCQTNAITVTWYTVVAPVVLSFLVSYAAMFGFDKLKETLQSIG